MYKALNNNNNLHTLYHSAVIFSILTVIQQLVNFMLNSKTKKKTQIKPDFTAYTCIGSV